MTGRRQLAGFPDVDEEAMREAAGHVDEAVGSLVSARQGVTAVRGSDSWTSAAARPSWDALLDERRADLGAAREVMAHFRNVLTTAASEIARHRAAHQRLTFRLDMLGDPWSGPPGDLEDLLGASDDPPFEPDPEQVAEYNRLVQRCNDVVNDAEVCLALCAHEMLAMTVGVTFADPPQLDVRVVVDPTGRIVPIVPFFPALGTPQGAIFVNGVPVPPQFVSGRAFEKSVLQALGITGERKSFFRPNAAGQYNLPRTRSGLMYRGTFPDSMRLGVLEIKSGRTAVTLTHPQIRVQLWVARTLNLPYNVIASHETPVSRAVLQAAQARGGSVYHRVPGVPGGNVFYDKATRQYVRLSATASQQRVPLSTAEVQRIPDAVRRAVEAISRRNPPPPPGASGGSGGGSMGSGMWNAGPGGYVTRRQFEEAWRQAGSDGYIRGQLIDEDGKPHRPAPQPPQLPTGPIVPLPVPGPLPLPLPGPVPFPVPGFPIPVFP